MGLSEKGEGRKERRKEGRKEGSGVPQSFILSFVHVMSQISLFYKNKVVLVQLSQNLLC